MNLIDISTVDKAVDPASFELIADNEYPICLLGFQIRNKYDQLRLQISEEYKPVDLLHFTHYPELVSSFFRGVRLQHNNETINKLLSDLRGYEFSHMNAAGNQPYRSVLNRYDLTCDKNFSLLQSGIFPIDSECLGAITSENIDMHKLYIDIFKNKDVLYYQAVGYFTIFILDNVNIANGSNIKAVKKIVETYKT